MQRLEQQLTTVCGGNFMDEIWYEVGAYMQRLSSTRYMEDIHAAGRDGETQQVREMLNDPLL
ncbi:hypothetical protein LJ739_13470 [Aestuariibacter halophilus]|uniref:Uncharacterized protein n=1 Tax=Fluctibacter halophilus TaxID=226011 RepID=A0ABS8G9L1_9ALTE|nr:hypothetical protein [Aestuariibacter halophilus]MCC2617257.1 hypothetical protein [Aestuariibacter halophilus]